MRNCCRASGIQASHRLTALNMTETRLSASIMSVSCQSTKEIELSHQLGAVDAGYFVAASYRYQTTMRVSCLTCDACRSGSGSTCSMITRSSAKLSRLRCNYCLSTSRIPPCAD